MKHRIGISCWLTPALFWLAGCGAPQTLSLEDLSSGVSWELQAVELVGRRDGDRMPVRVQLRGLEQTIAMNLDLRIGVPTRLTSGTYRWEKNGELLEGAVRARSLTFLGGQSDHPNLGGIFELQGADGSPRFQVTIPTMPVRPR